MSTLSLPQLALANASFVTPRLLVGGDLDGCDDARAAAQLAELVEHGVTHLVDVRLEANDEEFVAGVDPGVSYVWLGVDDAGQRIPDAWFDTGVGHVLAALEEPDAVVLAHCHMGINRGPSLGYAVLLAQGWDPVEAIDAIRAARPIAHVAYAEQALAWHHRRAGVDATKRRADRERLACWRASHPIDVVRIIARQRRLGL